jgi:hypothetical protein
MSYLYRLYSRNTPNDLGMRLTGVVAVVQGCHSLADVRGTTYVPHSTSHYPVFPLIHRGCQALGQAHCQPQVCSRCWPSETQATPSESKAAAAATPSHSAAPTDLSDKQLARRLVEPRSYVRECGGDACACDGTKLRPGASRGYFFAALPPVLGCGAGPALPPPSPGALGAMRPLVTRDRACPSPFAPTSGEAVLPHNAYPDLVAQYCSETGWNMRLPRTRRGGSEFEPPPAASTTGSAFFRGKACSASCPSPKVSTSVQDAASVRIPSASARGFQPRLTDAVSKSSEKIVWEKTVRSSAKLEPPVWLATRGERGHGTRAVAPPFCSGRLQFVQRKGDQKPRLCINGVVLVGRSIADKKT